MTPFPGVASFVPYAACWILFTFKLPKANRTKAKAARIVILQLNLSDSYVIFKFYFLLILN